MTAITAVTVQNTQGVSGYQALPPAIVADQIRAVVTDIGVDAAKTGMLASAEIVEAVAAALAETAVPNLVVDPVCRVQAREPAARRGRRRSPARPDPAARDARHAQPARGREPRRVPGDRPRPDGGRGGGDPGDGAGRGAGQGRPPARVERSRRPVLRRRPDGVDRGRADRDDRTPTERAAPCPRRSRPTSLAATSSSTPFARGRSSSPRRSAPRSRSATGSVPSTSCGGSGGAEHRRGPANRPSDEVGCRARSSAKRACGARGRRGVLRRAPRRRA